MLTVGVLYGGRSGEHDVSLCSAASIVDALKDGPFSVIAVGIDRDGRWHVQDRPVFESHPAFGRVLKLERTGPWWVNHYEDEGRLVLVNRLNGTRVGVDVVFPALHGTYCEDGTLQGLLELAMVPFVGADTLGSAIGMDKDVTKRLLRDGGIPVVPWVTIESFEWEKNRHEAIRRAAAMPMPLFVKPARAGSSVGVTKVKAEDQLEEAIDLALRYDTKALVEQGVNGREIECAVLGNAEPKASVLGEVSPRHEFYSYESKYLDPHGADLAIPAVCDPEISDAIRTAAVKAYRILCCSGMARIDFFLEKETNRFFCNEINTLPGFTAISMYPKLWEHTGVPYRQLVRTLIDLALERHRERRRVVTSR